MRLPGFLSAHAQQFCTFCAIRASAPASPHLACEIQRVKDVMARSRSERHPLCTAGCRPLAPRAALKRQSKQASGVGNSRR